MTPAEKPAGGADLRMVSVPVAGLLRIQWAYDEQCTDLWCPVCNNGFEHDGGHKADCWLGAAIATAIAAALTACPP